MVTAACLPACLQTVSRSGVVIRGAGTTRTTLLLNKSMTDLYGNTWCVGMGSARVRGVQQLHATP